MSSTPKARSNVKQAVPFFMVQDIDSSINFYVNGLGFSMTESWIDQGKIKWCWLNIDEAALMLQEYNEKNSVTKGNAVEGVEIFFICEDALAIYNQITLNGILASEPFV